MKTTLRPAGAEDQDFLFKLYASTRAHEIAAFGWPAAQQEAFLRMQFTAQQRGYESVYPQAEHQIVELGALMEQCAGDGAMLKLQVRQANPAVRLYERLRFIRTSEDAVYIHMERRPE
jgi:hypothetical protein